MGSLKRSAASRHRLGVSREFDWSFSGMDTRDVRRRAWKMHQEGELSKAEKAYRALLNTIPEDTDAANLGALLRNQGRLNESIEVYRTWVQRFPKSEKLLVNAINCAIEINSPKEALKWIEEYEKEGNTTVC